MGHDAFCEAPKLVRCDVEPVVFVVTANELGMLICFSCGGIDDGVSGVQFHGCICDLRGEAGDVMLDDDV
jgi:hypothetical protein